MLLARAVTGLASNADQFWRLFDRDEASGASVSGRVAAQAGGIPVLSLVGNMELEAGSAAVRRGHQLADGLLRELLGHGR